MRQLLLIILSLFAFNALQAQAPKIDTSARVSIRQPQTLLTMDMKQNSPNPFNKATTIGFYASLPQIVEFRVYDMLGNQVLNKQIEVQKGENSFNFERGNLAPGFYFYSVMFGGNTLTKRMLIRD